MSAKARAYIAVVTLIGAAVLAAGPLAWESANPAFFLVMLGLALVGATRKIALPGLTGTVSLNFLFVLVGVAEFSFSETLTLGCAAVLLQSMWKPKVPPRPVQVVFNLAAMAISIAVAYGGSHRLLGDASGESVALLLLVATTLLLVVNITLVAGVLALTEPAPFAATWQRCYALVFPYFVVGATLAGVLSLSSHTIGWQHSLLVVPSAYLLHVFYKIHLGRPAPHAAQG